MTPTSLSGVGMRLRIVAVTLLFAVGGCASPISLAGIMGGPVDSHTDRDRARRGHSSLSDPTLTDPVAAVPPRTGSTVTDPPGVRGEENGPRPDRSRRGRDGVHDDGPVPAATVAGEPPGAGPETSDMKPDTVQPRQPENGFPIPLSRRGPNARQIKCVALTFDDGPGPYTGMLLDILARYQVRATFFVLGRMAAEDHEGSLYRMVAQGHELGNHTVGPPGSHRTAGSRDPPSAAPNPGDRPSYDRG